MQKKTPASSKAAVIVSIILVVVLAFAMLVGIITTFFVLYGSFAEDKAIAKDVVAMIEKLEGKSVSLENAKEIEKTLAKYDSLTEKQKELISNYKVLDKAGAALKALQEQSRADQAAAGEVIDLIKTLETKTITLESESELAVIKVKYEALTEPQKSLVTNYDVLSAALNDLQRVQGEKLVEELVRDIDSVDSKALGTDATQINSLVARYDAMTEEQKALVTNYKKIAEYQKIVKANADKQAKIDKGLKLANNFPGYNGKWGDFGAHVNSYQAMIEEAIRKDADLRGHFYCENGPNYLEMTATRFSKNSDAFGIGSCSVTFTGYDKNYGTMETLYGEVVIKSDGSLYYTKTYYSGYYY